MLVATVATHDTKDVRISDHDACSQTLRQRCVQERGALSPD
jgi:hypothetical protein